MSPSNIEWAVPQATSTEPGSSGSPTSTFREYGSSPGCYRGFCEKCGTTLTWRNEKTPEKIDIMLGAVDEGCMEKELCIPVGGQFWCKNFIKGVTDIIPDGDKWVENNGESGVRWEA